MQGKIIPKQSKKLAVFISIIDGTRPIFWPSARQWAARAGGAAVADGVLLYRPKVARRQQRDQGAIEGVPINRVQQGSESW